MPHIGELLSLMAALPTSPAGVALAPSGSPYTWTAPSAGMLIVSGGTVSLVEVGRGAAFYVAGLVGGLIPVSAGDKVRMTYVVAPTATFLGR